MDGRFEYDVSASFVTNGAWLNVGRDLSSNCSKHYGATDKQGNLLTYVVDISFISDGDNSVNIYAAKENWVTKNAFKKWHALRDFMFKESGLTRKERGKYSHIIRPYFDAVHADRGLAGHITPQAVSYEYDVANEEWIYKDATGMTQGDWTYSNIAIETNPDKPGGIDETDVFSLHICGPNTGDAGLEVDQAWKSVGMIGSYMADRSHPTAEPADGPNLRKNPLALLKGRSESVADVLEISATEQLDGPPYDTNDTGDMINPVLAGFLNTTSTGQQVVTAFGVRLPGGLAFLEAAATCELRCVVRRVELASN